MKQINYQSYLPVFIEENDPKLNILCGKSSFAALLSATGVSHLGSKNCD